MPADRKARPADDDLFRVTERRVGTGVRSARYARAVPSFHRQQSRTAEAGAAKIPRVLFEHEAGNVQPVEAPYQEAPRRGQKIVITMPHSAAAYQAALDKLHDYLRGYAPFSKAEFRQMEPFIEIREFDKKVQVIREGEVERYLNVVAWGLARKYLPVRNKEITIQLASEGHMIHSELSFHFRVPSRSVIETIEPTVFFSISYESLEQLYEQFP